MPRKGRYPAMQGVVNLDALADIFHDADPPVVFRPAGEPPEHVRALMRTLGVTVEVVPVPVRSSPRSAVNKQVRVGEGTGGEIVVLGAWCPTCQAESMPNRHGYCSFCGTRILDEDSLSARAMRDQLAMPPPKPETAAAKRAGLTIDEAVASIKAWADEHGKPPTAPEWSHITAAHPSYATVIALLPWRDAIRLAGWEPPLGRRAAYRLADGPPAKKVAPAVRPPYREEDAARPTAADAGATEVARALILAARAFADTLERALLKEPAA